MILVFGGTTEGRIAVKTLDEGDGRYFYSTYGDKQEVECCHGTRLCGAMSADSMREFCVSNGIRLIVDAAHPFAVGLHTAVSCVAAELDIPVISFERESETCERNNVVMCRDYNDAMTKMRRDGVTRLLALTGVNTIIQLRSFWTEKDTYFRILDRNESREKAQASGFPMHKIVYYSPDNTLSLIDSLQPDAIITKESGPSGGVEEKIRAAMSRGIRAYVVERPPMPAEFISVGGRHGLRRMVERLLPDFYKLHTGFTTGSCATAAAKAALMALLSGHKLATVSFRIPEGECLEMSVENVEVGSKSAVATVIKDAGDDPDVTDKHEITVKVAYADHPGIRFIGGEGIGTVTLPGLGLEVGEPAINPVPRKMITDELSAIYSGGLDVTISLKGGSELAPRTFNPRVGVTGGVSIIGTTGIVRPFSHEAFVESIRRSMNVAKALGCERVVVNSGGRSERCMRTFYSELPQQAFVHYGNAIGETMAIAAEVGISAMSIGLMIGKAVKLAEGNMDTHSHVVTLNREFLQHIAAVSGCSDESVVAIGNINLARELWTLMPKYDADKFFPAILCLCRENCAMIYGDRLETILINDENEVAYRCPDYFNMQSL